MDDLQRALQAVSSVEHLSRVFESLRYQPASVNGGADTTVARWRGFRVRARQSDGAPRAAAQSMAREYARTADRALALALRGRELAVAAPRIGAPGSTRVLLLNLDAPDAWSLNQLRLIRPAEQSTALTHALRVAEVLDAEPAGDRFFAGLRLVFERMEQETTPLIDSPEDRRTLAVVTLTRVLFLYFIQARGWLGGRLDYVRWLFDRVVSSGRQFHGAGLAPLFFGVLNRPPEQRRRQYDIPYLNGGLFEPHPVERRHAHIAYSNELWRDTLDDLFERFRFCVSESPDVNAVAPDMLGRVFERLGTPDRHGSGTFYTPENLVRQMVGACIETCLAADPRIGAELARRLLHREPLGEIERVALRTRLERLTILDPAAGSGAFLLGALDLLADLHQHLDPGTTRRRHKHEILRRSLFGVDQSPMAVRLAELRLWLALVADDPEQDISRIEPLPNLGGVMRQGDSLMDPVSAAADASPAMRIEFRSLTERVAVARRGVFEARGHRRERQLGRLRQAELELGRGWLVRLRDRALARIAELDDLAAAANLFGAARGLNHGERRRRDSLVAEAEGLTRQLGELDDGRAPFFSYDVQAADVMQAGGFDIVCGNPPWVRAERLDPGQRGRLSARYRWWRPQGRGYAHHPDLSVAFLERAFELVAPGGVIGFLVPSKLATAGYGAAARQALVRESRIRYLYRVPEKDASRFGATTYPLAVVAERTHPTPDTAVRIGFDTDATIIPQERLSEGPWLIGSTRQRDALERFLRSGQPLADLAAPMLGVKTGLNAAFLGRVVRPGEDVSLVRLDGRDVLIETELLRPALRGRDLAAFTWNHEMIVLWAYDSAGQCRARLPPRASAYFKSLAQRLARRVDARGGRPWSLFRTAPLARSHLVVWPDITQHPRSVVIRNQAASPIPLNTCYVAAPRSEHAAHAICAVLNTVWTRAVLMSLGDEARGGYRRFNARIASIIPMPCEHERMALAELSRHGHRNAERPGQLDETVAETLGLDARTRAALRELAGADR